MDLSIIKSLVLFILFIFFNLTIIYIFVNKIYVIRKTKSEEELDSYYKNFENLFAKTGAKKFAKFLQKK